MSQEIQLAYPRGAMSSQIEPWAMGGNGSALGPVAPPATSPLIKIHRSMRGRYVLAVVLALLGAALGGAAGFLAGKPGFVSQGAIRVRPTVPTPDKAEVIMAMYDRFMTTQAGILMSDRVINFALAHPDWKAVNPNFPPNGTNVFATNLKAEFVKGTELIQVSYTDRDPVVAQAAVKAVIKSYDQHFARQETDDLDKRLDYWKEQRRDANDKIKLANLEIEENGRKYGTQDLTILANSTWQTSAETERELQQAQNKLDEIEHATGTAAEDMRLDRSRRLTRNWAGT